MLLSLSIRIWRFEVLYCIYIYTHIFCMLTQEQECLPAAYDCRWKTKSSISSVQSLSYVRLFVTTWSAGCQTSCPSPTPRAYSGPSSRWCHSTISSSVVPFSSFLQSFPASGSFQISQFFSSGGQSIGVSGSASVLPMNIQDWFPLGQIGWISLQ